MFDSQRAESITMFARGNLNTYHELLINSYQQFSWKPLDVTNSYQCNKKFGAMGKEVVFILGCCIVQRYKKIFIVLMFCFVTL